MAFVAFWLFLFGVLVIAVNYLLTLYGRPHKRFVLAIAHFLVILVLAADVYADRNDAQMGMTWIAAMVLDFPISMLYISLKPLLRLLCGDDHLGRVLYAPTAFHGFLGTLQYFLIGYFVDRRKAIGDPKPE